MQQRYNGRFCWSLHMRGHASWCYLQVLQAGKPGSWLVDPDQSAVVILTSVQDNPGTGIETGVEDLAAQVVDMFRLNPQRTVFLVHTPPVPLFPEYEPLPEEDPVQVLERLTSSVFGSTEDKDERVTFALWQRTQTPDGLRSRAEGPNWTPPISPLEVTRLIQQLDHCSV